LERSTSGASYCPKVQSVGLLPITFVTGSSYQTEIAIPSARRLVVLPEMASQPDSLKALNAVLVLRTSTLDRASQSLILLIDGRSVCAGEGLDLHGRLKKSPGMVRRGLVVHAINPRLQHDRRQADYSAKRITDYARRFNTSMHYFGDSASVSV
jgi:hypothetical protein